jgi:hypothetical protein
MTPSTSGATPTPADGAVVLPGEGDGLPALGVAAVTAGLVLLALAAFIGWRRLSARRL